MKDSAYIPCLVDNLPIWITPLHFYKKILSPPTSMIF